jgi:ankyrin repeat protein
MKNVLKAYWNVLGWAAVGLVLAMGSANAGTYEDLLQSVDDDNSGWLRDMINAGADPNTVAPDGNSLLILAVRDGKKNVFPVLVESKANVDFRNANGETALMVAAIQGRSDMASKLVFAGAQFEFKGWNPLLYAATGGKDEVVKLLLDLGANINAVSDNGTTPLMMAVRGGHKSTVKLLLDRGANPNMKNERGETALTWAMDRGYTEIGTALVAHGAK